MLGNLPLSITARANKDVSCYEHQGGWSCISIDEHQRLYVVRASDLELEPSELGESRSGEDSEEERPSKW